MSYTTLSPSEFAALDGLDDWRYLLGAIHATYVAGSFPAATDLFVAITAAAGNERRNELFITQTSTSATRVGCASC
jgi:hypothetical protein